ncbi:TetR/AcrR family transcriptional regulator [Asticcacaulis sp. ZE23SCel15]|uniref:TetR/AcrR family transcriptional regulator n=1 Tax=Asticcacaulis sp. ZE23SCel15 TaxID=3059027 RepID=UPI00265E7E07|nr:TetR/AcrR family transcriptional regulator [Asticcacaulis sp. ZE23SCel15]WKL56090.1 TetR/AcrR family transcriptional regulator [Asticcacaulis sp. ZE23SCel15]
MNSQNPIVDVREDLLDTAQTIMSGKGFSAVGLNEILSSAGVPKGSFYYYFASKEAFGEALLRRYFENYLAAMDSLFNQPDLNAARQLKAYFQGWLDTQTSHAAHSKCLVVKLAAEVADLSEAMRGVLLRGTTDIIERLATAIDSGNSDGSLSITDASSDVAEGLYQSWLGASLLAKITKDDAPLKAAMVATVRTLSLAGE